MPFLIWLFWSQFIINKSHKCSILCTMKYYYRYNTFLDLLLILICYGSDTITYISMFACFIDWVLHPFPPYCIYIRIFLPHYLVQSSLLLLMSSVSLIARRLTVNHGVDSARGRTNNLSVQGQHYSSELLGWTMYQSVSI